MLQIYLYGPTEQGFLDIEPNISLELESLSDAFDEDLTIGEYSLPIELLWTPNNKRLMGFAERLQNFENTTKEFRITVYDNFVPEIPIGKLTILEKSGMFTYQKGKFNTTISGGKGLFGSAIKNKKLRNFYFNGPITWTNVESRKFAEDVMKGNYPQYEYLSFAPVAIEDFIDKQRKDYTNEFLANDVVNNIIVTPNGGANDWIFERPSSADPNVPPSGGSIYERLDYRTVPFFKLMWVFKQMLNEVGYTASGDFITTTDFDNLVIFNNYSLEYYLPNYSVDYNRSIYPANHLPDITIAEFFKSVCELLNMFPVFGDANTIKLVYRETNLKNKTILPITNYVASDFVETFNDSQNNDSNGYKLAMKQDSADGYFSERVKDIKDKILAGSVGTYYDLAAFNPGIPLTTDVIVYVQADNMYYQVADATTPGAVKYDAFAEKLNDYEVDNAERTVDVGIGTLATYIEKDATSALQVKRNYVGTRQTGSYRNFANTIVISPFSFRIFYISKKVIDGVNIPVSYNHNRDANNNKIEAYSLSWYGDDGLAQFHKQWQKLRQKATVLKTNMYYNHKVLSELAANNTLEINNVLYVPYRINRRIPMEKNLEIRIVPL